MLLPAHHVLETCAGRLQRLTRSLFSVPLYPDRPGSDFGRALGQRTYLDENFRVHAGELGPMRVGPWGFQPIADGIKSSPRRFYSREGPIVDLLLRGRHRRASVHRLFGYALWS